jgi:hypothetical protein
MPSSYQQLHGSTDSIPLHLLPPPTSGSVSPSASPVSALETTEEPAISCQPTVTSDRVSTTPLRPSLLNQNFRTLVIHGLIRWIITVILIAGFYLVVRLYQNRILTPDSKGTFGFIIIGLSIGLGLNIASALKAAALDLRWWILTRKRRSAKEVCHRWNILNNQVADNGRG